MEFSYWATTTQPWSAILTGCRWAAEAGWRGVWVPDHFMPAADADNGPGPTDAERAPMLEGWVVLGALASAVPDVRLGLMVGGNTYRHPAVVANAALTLDQVSGGRAVLGLGAGWQRNEHERYGIDLGSRRERSDRLEEAAALCQAMLRAGEDRVDFSGEHYQLTQAPVAPGPVGDTLPLLIGGAGARRTLRTVALHADEWNAWGRPEDMVEHRARLEEHCAAVGRDPAEIHVTAAALLQVVDDADDAAERRAQFAHRSGLIGTIDELRQVVEEYAAAGVDELVVPDFVLGHDKIETLTRFHAEVVTQR